MGACGDVAAWIAASMVLLSVASFLTYAWDKAAAMRGTGRVAERTLHLLSLAGGWPGAWLAQRTLRHKSSKPAFLRLHRVTAALHVALCVGLLVWRCG